MNKVAGQGRLFVVAGPSGAGKGTLIEELVRRYPRVWLSVSATTRKLRPGEEKGVQYQFIGHREFQDHVRKGEFLEWAEVHGNLYGTPLSPVMEKMSQGLDVILEIDVDGARQVRTKEPDAVTIFILPPSIKVLGQRLRSRGTEEEGELKRRLESAIEERKSKDDFDYVVLNDDLDRAAEDFCSIYENESNVAKKAIKDDGRSQPDAYGDEDR